MSRLYIELEFETIDGGIHSFEFSPSKIPTIHSDHLFLSSEYFDSDRYFLSLTIDGQNYTTPTFGFVSISQMINWINQNLSSIGTWYHISGTPNKTVLYTKGSSGFLSISTLDGINGIQVEIPEMYDVDQYYTVVFDGEYSDALFSVSEIMAYVQSMYGSIGNWTTDGIYLVFLPNNGQAHTLEVYLNNPGAFDEGFDLGFTI